jgi:hypothetical protein
LSELRNRDTGPGLTALLRTPRGPHSKATWRDAFVTGYGREALPRSFRDAVVLTKPFDQTGLVATVELLVYQAAGVVALRRKQI